MGMYGKKGKCCKCCYGTGVQRTKDGLRIPCPFCNGTGKEGIHKSIWKQKFNRV